MNTRRINSAAEVINAALTQNRTAAGIALALESTGFLVTPELEQIRAQVAELEEQVAALQAQGSVPWQADGITRRVAPSQALREDDDPARCLKVHPFSPRDGWRMVCGNCDHGRDADCHMAGESSC